jgi:hypothetical protein
VSAACISVAWSRFFQAQTLLAFGMICGLPSWQAHRIDHGENREKAEKNEQSEEKPSTNRILCFAAKYLG